MTKPKTPPPPVEVVFLGKRTPVEVGRMWLRALAEAKAAQETKDGEAA